MKLGRLVALVAALAPGVGMAHAPGEFILLIGWYALLGITAVLYLLFDASPLKSRFIALASALLLSLVAWFAVWSVSLESSIVRMLLLAFLGGVPFLGFWLGRRVSSNGSAA